MIPVYFPYTCIADRVAEALAACFGSFVVYQPVSESLTGQMRAWKDRGIMDVRVPVTENENELKQAVKSYRSWADVHGENLGRKTVSLKGRLESMSLLTDFSSSHIVAEIKDNMGAMRNSQTRDPLLAARIFLYFAQEFDRQHHELAEDLLKYDRERAELIRRLKIEDDPVADEFADPSMQLTGQFDEYLISDRLESWSRLFFEDPDAPGLLVTHSPAVLDYLLECVPNPVLVMQSAGISPKSVENGKSAVWQEDLNSHLNRFFEQEPDVSNQAPFHPPAETAGGGPNALSVYLVPGQAPRDVLTRCTGIEAPAANQATSDRSPTHSLIALLRV